MSTAGWHTADSAMTPQTSPEDRQPDLQRGSCTSVPIGRLGENKARGTRFLLGRGTCEGAPLLLGAIGDTRATVYMPRVTNRARTGVSPCRRLQQRRFPKVNTGNGAQGCLRAVGSPQGWRSCPHSSERTPTVWARARTRPAQPAESPGPGPPGPTLSALRQPWEASSVVSPLHCGSVPMPLFAPVSGDPPTHSGLPGACAGKAKQGGQRAGAWAGPTVLPAGGQLLRGEMAGGHVPGVPAGHRHRQGQEGPGSPTRLTGEHRLRAIVSGPCARFLTKHNSSVWTQWRKG